MPQRGLKGRVSGLALLLALSMYGWASVAGAASSVSTTELRTTTSLMQNWAFVQDDTLTADAALASTGADWQRVSLPHTWNSQDE